MTITRGDNVFKVPFELTGKNLVCWRLCNENIWRCEEAEFLSVLNATGNEAIIAPLKCVVGTLSTEDPPKMVEVRRHLYDLIFEMDTFDKNIKGDASAIRAENKGVEIEMLKLLAAIVASPITGHWGAGIFRSVHDVTTFCYEEAINQPQNCAGKRCGGGSPGRARRSRIP